MKLKKYIFPLIVNGPSLVLIGALFIKMAAVLPRMPERIPLHFNWNGMPDRWGSPNELAVAALPALIIWGSSVLIAYLWASSEREKKEFNWLSPLMAAPVGFMAGIFWALLENAPRISRFTMPWKTAALFCAGTVGITALIEYFRPFIPDQYNAYQDRAEHYLPRIQARLQHAGRDGKVAYWESQDPLMARIGVLILIMILGIGSLGNPYQALFILPAFALYGGIRVWITADWVRIKLGVMGIPLRRIKRSEIAGAEVHEFSPLRDFGGWGVRVGRGGVVGFFYAGNVGVMITEQSGRKTLIGSNNPARLAAVIATALVSNEISQK